MEAEAETIEGTAEEIPAGDEEGGRVTPGREVVHAAQAQQGVTLFRTDDPVEVLERAGAAATALKQALVTQGMTTKIQGRDHVNVEGWQTVGAMLGVYPVKEWVRELPWPTELTEVLQKQKEQGRVYGYEASYLAQRADGSIVGSGEGTCSRGEVKPWLDRSDNALRSMAQTRATSRALKAPLGFVVTMAGYTATPAEEMPDTAPATEYGEVAGGDLRQKLLRALDYLLHVDGVEPDDTHKAAVGLIAALERENRYMPRVVARALCLAAAQLKQQEALVAPPADQGAGDDADSLAAAQAAEDQGADAPDDTAVMGGQEGAEQE